MELRLQMWPVTSGRQLDQVPYFNYQSVFLLRDTTTAVLGSQDEYSASDSQAALVTLLLAAGHGWYVFEGVLCGVRMGHLSRSSSDNEPRMRWR